MIEDLALVSSILAVPVLAGALKGMSGNGMVRTLVKILAPAAGIFPLCYLFYTILQQSGVQVGFDPAHPGGGSVAVIVFAACSYIASMRLVDFGERIGDQEHSGVRNDIKRAADAMMEAIGQKLQEHMSGVGRATGEAVDKRIGPWVSTLDGLACALLKELADLEGTFKKSMGSTEALQSLLEKNRMICASQQEMLEKMGGLYASSERLVNSLDEKHTIIEARIQALGGKEEPDESLEEDISTDTNLTAQDGSANRNIGMEAQHEMAGYLSDLGFEIREGRAAGEADYIIKKDGRVVAIGSNKAYMLYDEPKRMQRRISSKDVEPEIALARRLGVPMVILVTNRRNSRRWAQTVTHDMIAEWSGVSTPVMLAKDDEQSGRILEEEFSSVLASFGAVV